jgi:hypothetical protein
MDPGCQGKAASTIGQKSKSEKRRVWGAFGKRHKTHASSRDVPGTCRKAVGMSMYRNRLFHTHDELIPICKHTKHTESEPQKTLELHQREPAAVQLHCPRPTTSMSMQARDETPEPHPAQGRYQAPRAVASSTSSCMVLLHAPVQSLALAACRPTLNL